MVKPLIILLGILMIVGLFAGCTSTPPKFQPGDVVTMSNWSDTTAVGYCIVSQEKDRDNYILQPVNKGINGDWTKLAGSDIKLGSISVIDKGYKKIDHTTCP